MYDINPADPNESWHASGWYYADPLLHPVFGLRHYSLFSGESTSDPASILGLAPIDDSNAGSYITLSFNTKTANAATDLMAATGTSTQANATAPMLFKHLLSQVNFAIQGVGNVKIFVKDIKVNNILVEGEYTLDDAIPADHSAWNTSGSGLDFFSYEITTGGGGVHETTGNKIPNGGTSADIIEYLGNGNGINNNNTNALMLMPQQVSTGTGTITFEYKIEDIFGNLLVADEDMAPDDTDGFNSATFNLNNISNITQWDPGYRYLYILSFETPDYIKFNVNIDGWLDTTGEEIKTNLIP